MSETRRFVLTAQQMIPAPEVPRWAVEVAAEGEGQ